jgi:hypothetical protein
MTTWVTIAGYLFLLAAMSSMEIIVLARPQRLASLNQMLDFVMTSRTTCVGIIAAWWWLGWHFLFAPTAERLSDEANCPAYRTCGACLGLGPGLASGLPSCG